MNPIDNIIINKQFCGPPGSGNGGYVCGRLAHYIEGPAVVRLMVPPPLDKPLKVVAADDGVQLMDGDTMVGRARAGSPDIRIPASPGIESAKHCREHYAGFKHHAFPGCFVCGTDRDDGDGLLVFAGPVNPDELFVACNWTPHESFCNDKGNLPEHLVWASLDCPSGWAFLSTGEDVALLGEYSVEVRADLHCGREYVLAGWEYERSGRKRLTGSAIYDTSGEPLAWARATWITINQPEN